MDAKARTVFEQFREDDIAAGEAELEELSGQRKQALEQAEERRNFHQQELERLHSEIQSTELDRECGMLSQEEIEELNRARTEFAGLNAKIEVLSKLVQASPEAAGKQEQDIKQMQASIQQKKELLSALAFYISKRVEINFSKLRMNRVSITLYDVVKSTGEGRRVPDFYRRCGVRSRHRQCSPHGAGVYRQSDQGHRAAGPGGRQYGCPESRIKR